MCVLQAYHMAYDVTQPLQLIRSAQLRHARQLTNLELIQHLAVGPPASWKPFKLCKFGVSEEPCLNRPIHVLLLCIIEAFGKPSLNTKPNPLKDQPPKEVRALLLCHSARQARLRGVSASSRVNKSIPESGLDSGGKTFRSPPNQAS